MSGDGDGGEAAGRRLPPVRGPVPWCWWARPSATWATCRPGPWPRSASADVVYCEDTRHSRKLLTHAGISGVPLRSLHEHNERDRVDEVVAAVAAGRTVALVSDAGMPAVSDPGARRWSPRCRRPG